MLELDELHATQRAGANACANGIGYFDNPYLRNIQPPIEEWKARHDAWAAGWDMENAMREPERIAALVAGLAKL
jgi:hypothetical protein